MDQHHSRRSRTVYIASVAALSIVVALSCDSPFEPRGEGERVPVGREITDDVSGDTVARYSFVTEVGGPFAIFLEALDGAVQLAVRDSTDPYLFTFLSAGPGSPSLYQNATATFPTEPGDVYQLRVNAVPAGTHARFRFVVYPIDTSPELRSAEFAFGDTVAGETIDPIVDLDEFVAHGEAGQEIVAVGETPGLPGSGSVALTVIDPVTKDLLGYVFADAGTTNPLTTGRLRLPATRDYRFTLGSVTSNQYPRYRGPYRFWTYLVNRAPEHRASPIPFGTEIGSERIDRAGDVDEFTFQAQAGADFNAFVQAARAVQLEVAPPTGPGFAAASSAGSDTALFLHATGRFQITQPGTYVVRVAGANPYQVADTGGYRFYLYAIDRRPEHVPAAITPGDTVSGEDIGLPGDIDEFTFNGAAGEEFNAFLQAQSGSPETQLQLDVLDGGGTVLRSAQSLGTDTSLLRQVTGRFALPGTGTYRLRVSGVPSYPSDLSRGAYRLFLYRINRRPETLPETLAFGDSLSGETIDLPGDVDEFRVTVPDSSGANLALKLESPAEGGLLAVQLVDSATGRVIATASTYQAATRAATGRMRVAAGKYVVRVSTSDYLDRPILRGPYRLWFYRFGFGPEAVSDTFAVGDTVSGEAIEPWGDADRFHFYGVRGQHVNALFQGLAPASGGGFETWITLPGADFYTPAIFIVSPTASGSLEEHQTTRLELPATGWYGVEVHGAGGGISEQGGYRFAVVPINNTTPEHVGATLVPGDSVTTEPIDTLGDWDEFTVSAMPGQDLGIIFDGRPGTVGPFVYVRAFDPVSGDTLGGTVGQSRRFVGPFRTPANGLLNIAVFEPGGFFRICYDARCGAIYRFVGTYGFHLNPVNRAPETASATFTVGDTVRGEAIDPAGDFDEFTANGVPGETLTAYIRLTADPVGEQYRGLTLEVINPATGDTLIGQLAQFFGQTFGPVGSFTVPASGGFLIRVRGTGTWGEDLTTAPYEFFVKRGP